MWLFIKKILKMVLLVVRKKKSTFHIKKSLKKYGMAVKVVFQAESSRFDPHLII